MLLYQRDLTIVQKVVEADDQVDALYRLVHEEVVEHRERPQRYSCQAIWRFDDCSLL